MKRKYGTDEYGRYEEIGGVRYLIEPHPFMRSPLDLWYKFTARIKMIRWYIGCKRGGSA